tara:strand:+ start:1068 stop:1856 length:789 start_codon:yes stop_codon:yes gene_type:complete
MANPFRRMFFDIETSYMEITKVFRLGEQYIRPEQIRKHSAIICICWKFEGEEKIHSLQWEKGCDKKLIKEFVDIVNSCDEVIAHNGDGFDIKWIRTRGLFHGITTMPDIKSIDTLKVSRSKFKLPSNKLDEIAKYFNIGKKLEHRGMPMWEDVIERNCKKSMKEMIAYCKMDVEVLEKVYHKFFGYITPKTHLAVFLGGEKWDCPHCASERTMISTTKFSKVGTVWTQMKCNACKRFFSVSEAVRRGYLEFKLKQERRKHNL